MVENTLKNKERIKHKRIIQRLFIGANSFAVYPIRIAYFFTQLPSKSPIQIMVSAPKKRLKKATQRNYVKRILREAYRTNKHPLINVLNEKKMQVAVLVMYTGTSDIQSEIIRDKIIVSLQRLTEFIQSTETTTDNF
jgi:ribonuclease P protein component